MHEFRSNANQAEPGRMTEEEARELMQRLAATDQAREEASALPSVQDVASLLGTDETRVQRELEILRHERRIAELEQQRKEEEELLRRMRAEREVVQDVVEDETARREAWRLRQEQMERWSMRGDATIEEQVVTQGRKRTTPVVAIVVALLLLLFLFLMMSVTTTEPSIERTTGGPTTETR